MVDAQCLLARMLHDGPPLEVRFADQAVEAGGMLPSVVPATAWANPPIAARLLTSASEKP